MTEPPSEQELEALRQFLPPPERRTLDNLRATVAKLTEKNDRQANTIGLLDKKVAKLTEERDSGWREARRCVDEIDQLRAQLAERDGQIAALREALDRLWAGIGNALCSGKGIAKEYSQSVATKIREALASTAQAAAEYEARIKAPLEAQIAALRRQFLILLNAAENAYGACVDDGKAYPHDPTMKILALAVDWSGAILTNTAHAAAAHDERVRAPLEAV